MPGESTALPPMIGPQTLRGPTDGPPHGPPSLRFVRPTTAQAAYMLSGTSRDSNGAILGNCTVDLFYSTGDKQRAGSTTSDANGAYSFLSGDNVSTYFCVFYKAGSPDVAGTTANTLTFT